MRVIILNLILVLSIISSVRGLLGHLKRHRNPNLIYKTLAVSEGKKKYIDQPVDNFNKSDTRKFKNLYVEDDRYFKKDGPIFINIIGETALEINTYKDPTNSPKQFIDVLAEKANAVIITIEHRYYGNTIPSEDMKYLRIKQALADMANLITELKKQEQYKNSKVVTIGGSYAGVLSAWMRSKYPDLVDAAIASSAPFEGIVDYYGFKDKVTEVFKLYGTPGCADTLRKYYKQLQFNLTTHEGIAFIKKNKGICESSDLTNKLNQQYFIDNDLILLEIDVQFGTPKSIHDYCESITKSQSLFVINDNFVHRLYEKNSTRFDSGCSDVNLELHLKELRTSRTAGDSIKVWIYQTCTELGGFKVASNESIFVNLLTHDYYMEYCKQVFDIDEKTVEDGVKTYNDNYGALPLNISKVVFYNGGIDPWGLRGLKHNISDDAPVYFVPTSFHTADLQDIHDSDSEEIKKVREIEEKLILEWIK